MNALLYALTGGALFVLGFHALVVRCHVITRVLALNVMSSGAFLAIVGLGPEGGAPDPVPRAMVLTGIVVAISVTAVALALVRRLYALTGSTGTEDDTR